MVLNFKYESSATSCLFMYTYHDGDDAGWKWEEEISEASLWNLQLSWQ